MSRLKKPAGRAASMFMGVGIGVAVAWAVALALAAILAAMIGGGGMDIGMLGYGMMAILFLSSAAGALLATMLIKHKKMQVCLITGGVYFATLLAVNIIGFGGVFDAMAVTAILIAIASALVAVVSSKGKRPVNPMRKLKAYR